MKKVARLRIPMPDEMTSTGTHSTTNSNEMSVRTTGRIKKPKAVFDPSDNYLPRAQRAFATSSTIQTSITSHNSAAINTSRTINNRLYSIESVSTVPSTSLDACIVCQKREAKRGSHANKNKLITCMKCEKKVHRLCLDIDYEDLEYLRQNFKCENCRTCEMCYVTSDMNTIHNDAGGEGVKDFLTCAKCLKSFHSGCHFPRITAFCQNWKCNNCATSVIKNSNITNNNSINNAVTVTNRLANQQQQEHQQQQQQQQQVNGNTIPSKSVREVVIALKKTSNETKVQTDVKLDKVNIAAAAAEAKASSSKRSHSNERNIHQHSSNASNSLEKRFKRENNNNEDVCSSSSNNNQANSNNTNFVTYSPNEQIDIPDVKYWTVDQVTEFFSKYFPQEAYVFKDQEIDGTSLLLLKRSDVIKKLPIKLGPSLRMYNLILKIQTQSNDATLGWNCDL